jgi:rhodanese-related sulfurtransferase
MNDRNDGALTPQSIDQTTPVLDVRRSSGRQQIRGALQYDAKALLDADPLTLPLPHDRPVAVYGDDDESVRRVVERLRNAGYAGAAALMGGIEAWKKAGLPLEEVTEDQPVPGEPGAGIHDL